MHMPKIPNLDVNKANAHVGEGVEPSAYKRMSEKITKLWFISSSVDSTLPSFDKRLIFVEILYSLCIFCRSILFNMDHASVDSSISTRSGVTRVKNVHFFTRGLWSEDTEPLAGRAAGGGRQGRREAVVGVPRQPVEPVPPEESGGPVTRLFRRLFGYLQRAIARRNNSG
ncbi:hypothetical protein CDAR_111961 [Caerostris darwini]|uniref:Uncharacterized protein n=1 Tax=Caerostris darwini TaxID=1538125 RepID=A0AAV4PMB0_9ARAC|nr:hypothetical protein CDAR_111961 [Caerostris darwini]